MATDAASLMQQGKCYVCLDHKERSVAEIALLAQILLANNKMADVSPSGLIKAGTCYQCLLPEQREIALLALLAALVGSPGISGACITGGIGPPVGLPPCNFSVYIQQPPVPVVPPNPLNFGLWLGDTVNGWGNVLAQGP